MKKKIIFIFGIVFLVCLFVNSVSAANCTNRDPITISCECNGITRTSGYCCYYQISPTINITHQPTQECGYTEVSPHWSGILTSKEDYRYPSQSQVTAENEWNTKHYDLLIRDPQLDSQYGPVNLQFNPRITMLVYRLDISYFSLIDLFGTYASLQDYAVANDYNIEDAFLHYSETTVVNLPSGSITIVGCPIVKNQSCRVVTQKHIDPRWMINPMSNLSRNFFGYEWNRLTTTPNSLGNYYDGIFLDEHPYYSVSGWSSLSSGGTLLEYNLKFNDTTFQSRYNSDLTTFISAQNIGMQNSKILLLNHAEYVVDSDAVLQTQASDGAFYEFMLDPNRQKLHIVMMLNSAQQLYNQTKIAVFSTRQKSDSAPIDYIPTGYTPGSYSSTNERAKIVELAMYYLGRDTAGKLAYFNILGSWGIPYPQSWTITQEVDIGMPIGNYYTYRKNTNPNYEIFARNFTRGIVLFRPKEDWNYNTFDDTTAVIVTLPEVMTPVKGDGTLMVPTNQFTLRNSEGVILLKQAQTSSKSPDVNSDGSINIIDLALTTYWQGRSTGLGDNYNHLDITDDGVVNWLDVLQVIFRM
jgi:hypothetical protein